MCFPLAYLGNTCANYRIRLCQFDLNCCSDFCSVAKLKKIFFKHRFLPFAFYSWRFNVFSMRKKLQAVNWFQLHSLQNFTFEEAISTIVSFSADTHWTFRRIHSNRPLRAKYLSITRGYEKEEQNSTQLHCGNDNEANELISVDVVIKYLSARSTSGSTLRHFYHGLTMSKAKTKLLPWKHSKIAA